MEKKSAYDQAVEEVEGLNKITRKDQIHIIFQKYGIFEPQLTEEEQALCRN